MKSVPDASFILNLIFNELNAPSQWPYFSQIQESDIFVPSHFNQEVSHALYIAQTTNRISNLEANLFSRYLSEINIVTAASPPIDRLKEFCLKNLISSYDAAYLILAQDLDAKLFTSDLQMKKVAKKLQIATAD